MADLPCEAQKVPIIATAPPDPPTANITDVAIEEPTASDDAAQPMDDEPTAGDEIEEAAPPPDDPLKQVSDLVKGMLSGSREPAAALGVAPAAAVDPTPTSEDAIVPDSDDPAPLPAVVEEDQSLQVQLRVGDDPWLVFRRVAALRCGMHWADVPVRESPTLPDGVARKLRYLDDSNALMDSDLNLMHATFRDHGYEKCALPSDEWAVWWHSNLLRDAELPKLAAMLPHQRLNKFPGAGALTHKARLWEVVRDAALTHGYDHFDFLPLTFILPAELEAYEACMLAEEAEGKYWILKPTERSRGTGIFVHQALPESSGWMGAPRGGVMPNHVRNHIGVASRYVDPPMLLDGLKFDLRLYVLITSVHPLVVYMYDEGLARFATEVYDLKQPLDRRCMHLTNYSLNKKAKDFVANTDEEVDGVGSKWSLSALRMRLRTELGDERAARVWGQVDELVVKACIAAEPTMSAETSRAIPTAARGEPVRSCFQLFGFDVMLDADAKPWLLEVNCDPALGMGSPLDLKIKSQMLCDALNVVGMPVPTASSSSSSHRAHASKKSHQKQPPEPQMSDMQRWQAGAAIDGKAGVEQWALHLVDAEYSRSKSGRWKRLLPCRQGAERYLPLLDPTHTLNALPFAVNDDDEPSGELYSA